MGAANLILSSALLFGFVLAIAAFTDPLDLMALQRMYIAMDCPQQLMGWKSDGGDPCGKELWKGVTCSGQFVTAIKIRALRIGGFLALPEMGFNLLKELDISNNNIGGEIPNSLPKNATLIDLSCNQFTMNIPPLQSLKCLGHLNMSHNLLSGPIRDVFFGLDNLKELDLSFNKFSEELPTSFTSLSNLLQLYLQGNTITGSVSFLTDLPLNILNIEDNFFSGFIPKKFHNIKMLKIDGNMFEPGFAHPPYLSEDVPPENKTIEKSIKFDNRSKRNLVKRVMVATISSMIFLTIFATIIIIMCRRSEQRRSKRQKENNEIISSPNRLSKEDEGHSRVSRLSGNIQNITPPRKFEEHNWNGNPGRSRTFAITTGYTLSDLSLATNDFSQENLITEGCNFGCVYMAGFPDGQVFAVKKMDFVTLTIEEECKVLDVLFSISDLNHPNIMGLRGYCIEQGQYFLIHDYYCNGSLDDILHSQVTMRGSFTWRARVKISIFIARALEYLHLACPSVMAHGNLHPRNILLDDKLIPHVSDYGLNSLEPLLKMKIKPSCNAVYNAPEHGELGIDMTKSDIFSFGLVLLELLTGERPVYSTRSPGGQLLVKLASSDFNHYEVSVDPAIKKTLPLRTLSAFVDIISLCIQPQPELRPPITEIKDMLVRLVDAKSHEIEIAST